MIKTNPNHHGLPSVLLFSLICFYIKSALCQPECHDNVFVSTPGTVWARRRANVTLQWHTSTEVDLSITHIKITPITKDGREEDLINWLPGVPVNTKSYYNSFERTSDSFSFKQIDVTEDDTGKGFKCELLFGGKRCQSENATIVVDVSPVITEISSIPDTSVMEGNEVTLECLAESDPQLEKYSKGLNYTWKDRRGPIQNSSYYMLTNDSRQLKIHSVQLNKTTISCEVTEKLGSTRAIHDISLNIIPRPRPDAPKNVTIEERQDSLLISWQFNNQKDHPILGFIIQYRTGNSSWLSLANVTGHNLRYFSDKSPPGTTYYYRVFAYTEQGVSHPSEPVSFQSNDADMVPQQSENEVDSSMIGITAACLAAAVIVVLIGFVAWRRSRRSSASPRQPMPPPEILPGEDTIRRTDSYPGLGPRDANQGTNEYLTMCGDYDEIPERGALPPLPDDACTPLAQQDGLSVDSSTPLTQRAATLPVDSCASRVQRAATLPVGSSTPLAQRDATLPVDSDRSLSKTKVDGLTYSSRNLLSNSSVTHETPKIGTQQSEPQSGPYEMPVHYEHTQSDPGPSHSEYLDVQENATNDGGVDNGVYLDTGHNKAHAEPVKFY